MKGNVIGFDADTNTGAISGHDGKRYDFARQDWQRQVTPRHGDVVDFNSIGDRATQIYLLEPVYVRPGFWAFYFSPKSRISRSQYWLWYFLPATVIGIVLSLLSLTGNVLLVPLPKLFQLIMLWPGIAIVIKRIHDRNKSGWLVWALYVPLVLTIIFVIGAVITGVASAAGPATVLGIIAGVFGVATFCVMVWFFVEFGCMRGTIGANKYGPDPVPHA